MAKGEQREQHQSRKKVERDEQKRYNKRSRYSESETLFLQWANGPSPAGETKRFTRFGEHRFYEKSVSGCVEITASQYAKEGASIMQMTTDEHITELMRLLIMMDLKKKEIFEIAAAMETTEMLKRFLDKLSAKNYDMTPEEVYQASIETVEETM